MIRNAEECTTGIFVHNDIVTHQLSNGKRNTATPQCSPIFQRERRYLIILPKFFIRQRMQKFLKEDG
jgi:hypothetical protein